MSETSVVRPHPVPCMCWECREWDSAKTKLTNDLCVRARCFHPKSIHEWACRYEGCECRGFVATRETMPSDRQQAAMDSIEPYKMFGGSRGDKTATAKRAFIVWNQAKTEGFVTTEKQLAYEVRKGAESNCFDSEGRRSSVGQAFCEAWFDDDCTIEEIEAAK